MTAELAVTQRLVPVVQELRTLNDQLVASIGLEMEPLRWTVEEAMSRIRLAKEHVKNCGASTDAVDRAYSRIELVARQNVQDLVYTSDEEIPGLKRFLAGCKYVCREAGEALTLAVAQIDAQHAEERTLLRKAPAGKKKRIAERMSRQQFTRNDVVLLQHVDAQQRRQVAEQLAVCNLLVCAAESLQLAASAFQTTSKAVDALALGRRDDARVLVGMVAETLSQGEESALVLTAEIEKVIQLLNCADDRIAYARRAEATVYNALEALAQALSQAGAL